MNPFGGAPAPTTVHMNDLLAFAAVAALWFLMQFVILPRMGVPT
ncbi:conserved hypothetical protein [Anaeromyxobacter dehalogenans 2CP-1]|uniref:Uncharacterized protein n=1 Tax=Anaeromyxobacter dehalogenans (strain ATCC BAA-258 / DSM 21875 / 2CP-1) TaxID=455488 RepID=B8J9K3_ANAD2|nr:conserved hypothetical protein [Anaeromyxobacter dehalogenans 2CP-1]